MAVTKLDFLCLKVISAESVLGGREKRGIGTEHREKTQNELMFYFD